jgi:hypothetical protein
MLGLKYRHNNYLDLACVTRKPHDPLLDQLPMKKGG